MAKRFGFPRSEKLKSRKAIEDLYLTGKSFAVFPIRVHYKFIDGDADIQVGVTVSKRHFKKAVDRNRIKRLLREAYRLQKTELREAINTSGKKLHVFFTYTDKTLPQFEEIKIAMQQCLGRLQKYLQQENAGTA